METDSPVAYVLRNAGPPVGRFVVQVSVPFPLSVTATLKGKLDAVGVTPRSPRPSVTS